MGKILEICVIFYNSSGSMNNRCSISTRTDASLSTNIHIWTISGSAQTKMGIVVLDCDFSNMKSKIGMFFKDRTFEQSKMVTHDKLVRFLGA